MATLVQVENLRKEFGNVRALDGVSFRVNAGEWIAIMGPSGSGKTTLINILGGLDAPTAGQAIVDGTDVARLDEAGLTRFRAEKIGFIFQQFHLVPYLTAVENVMLAPSAFITPISARRSSTVDAEVAATASAAAPSAASVTIHSSVLTRVRMRPSVSATRRMACTSVPGSTVLI